MSFILACPIGDKKVDANIARANAGWTLFFALISIFMLFNYTGPTFLNINWVSGILFFIVCFLAFDFWARFKCSKLSLIAIINKLIIYNVLGFKNRFINAEPKRFAAKLGFLMTITTIVFLLLAFLLSNLTLIYFGKIVLILLIIASSLEFFLDFCVGCFLYSLLMQKNK